MFGRFAALIRNEQLRQARVRIIELEHALQDLIGMADHDTLCRQFGERRGSVTTVVDVLEQNRDIVYDLGCLNSSCGHYLLVDSRERHYPVACPECGGDELMFFFHEHGGGEGE